VIQQSESLQRKIIQREIGDEHDLNSDLLKGDERLEAIFDGDRKNYLRFGAVGEFVRKIQEGLMSLGFDLEEFGADGIIGSETTRAIKEFQSEHGLTPDGIVGIDTITSLDQSLSECSVVEDEDSELTSSAGESGTLMLKRAKSSRTKKCKISKKKKPRKKCIKILKIVVEFVKAIKDVNNRTIPIGSATATYDCGATLVISTVSGGSNDPSFGITDPVNGLAIFRIEDAAFKNSKGQPMPFALFYHGGEALHMGSLNKSSHGCVHVADRPKMQKMNSDSVQHKTGVTVKYAKGVLQQVQSGIP